MLIARVALFILLLAGRAASFEVSRDDFAFGYSIEVDGSGAVYSLALPHDVYAFSVWDNLADVRVFNENGEEVPHEFRHAEPQVNALLVRVGIPYFPLAGEIGPSGEDYSLEVRRNVGGEIVSIERKSEVQLPTRSYLLDLGKTSSFPLTLRLQWKTTGADVLLPVKIESSSDLLAWHREKRAILADLEFMGNRLHHSDIFLESKPARYLRLDLGEDGTVLRITGVEATSLARQAKFSRNWVEVPLVRDREDGEAHLKAVLEATVPMDRIQLLFPQPNSMLKARVETRSSTEPLRYRATSLFYDLLENGLRLKNKPVGLPRENVRHIRLDVIQDGTGAEREDLKLKIGYIPHDLVFIARGHGPFLLAYGNGRLQSGGPGENKDDIHGLVGEDRISMVRDAVLGEQVVLGGKERLAKKKESPWKKLVLWAVLLSGVALLAFMAWSLRRKKENSRPGH